MPRSSPTAKNGPPISATKIRWCSAPHPDFLTFPPDGPLRQITIQQMRSLKERASLKPLKGSWRVFLIDGIDRANPQAANSLLKTLEEPPPHLILILTARNPYDLLPTIRSRSVPFQFGRLQEEDMRAFIQARDLDEPERRLALAEGAPGLAVSIDLEAYDRRRTAMLALLKVAGGLAGFDTWLKHADSVARGERRSSTPTWKCCIRSWKTSYFWSTPRVKLCATMMCAAIWRLWRAAWTSNGCAGRSPGWTSWWNWGGATFRNRSRSMHSPRVCDPASAVLSMKERLSRSQTPLVCL